MGNSTSGRGGCLAAFFNFLRDIFGGSKPPASGEESPGPLPSLPPDNTTEPARIITSQVLLVVYDPVMDPVTGARLSQVMNWNRVDDLVNRFINDILETSGGLARYQIIQRIEINEFPALVDGFRYDPLSFMNMIRGGGQPHHPQTVDYHSILTGLNILPRLARHEIDEVWFFNFPYAGFYESIMGGPGAFWCNSNPLPSTDGSGRKFVMMGFSFERGLGEMLESFCHRAESLVAKAFDCQDFVAWAYRQDRVPATTGSGLNLFERYLCFDQIAPGQAGIGTVHFAPNSERDYDWGNNRKVQSSCYDWYNFPYFQNDDRSVDADEWGNGDMRAHHKWWLEHLPRVAGRTEGVANNWWQYIMDPNLINL